MFFVSLFSCDFEEGKVERKHSVEKIYKNLADSAHYVGKGECRKCHQSIYDKYVNTEMGRSLKKASITNSVANFHKQKPIYDDHKKLYYEPFVKNDKMFIREFRLAKNGKDTMFIRIEEINYIIGSGQHTNSHLMQRNGYLNQMPLTYYAQKNEWHLPPGYMGGNGGSKVCKRTQY